MLFGSPFFILISKFPPTAPINANNTSKTNTIPIQLN